MSKHTYSYPYGLDKYQNDSHTTVVDTKKPAR